MRFLAVQEFWKSVKIRQSYREFKGGNFLRQRVYNTCLALSKSLVVFTAQVKAPQQAQTTVFLPLSRVVSHDVDIDNFNILT